VATLRFRRPYVYYRKHETTIVKSETSILLSDEAAMALALRSRLYAAGDHGYVTRRTTVWVSREDGFRTLRPFV